MTMGFNDLILLLTGVLGATAEGDVVEVVTAEEIEGKDGSLVVHGDYYNY
jgi:hypothetical protein